MAADDPIRDLWNRVRGLGRSLPTCHSEERSDEESRPHAL